MADSLAAIILAGGASRRMGRDKASLLLEDGLGDGPGDGETLLERTLTAARSAGASHLVVAGEAPGPVMPPTPSTQTTQTATAAADVTFVREDPPRSGPVPALDAALEQVTAELVLVLPCDLADPSAAAAHLVQAAAGLGAGEDGLVAVDAGGHRQHLTALFRASALRRGATTGSGAGSTAVSRAPSGRVRDRLAGLSLAEVPEPAGHTGLWADMDTPEDLERVRSRLRGGGPAPTRATAGTASNIPGLDPWLRTVARELGLPPSVVVPGPLLDVARDVARGVIRPGAPTTTYLIGIAVGRALSEDGGSPEAAAETSSLVERLSERVQDLALGYHPSEPTEGDRP
ncbi:NTP transferase domain-containing protein [Citricoccus sp. NPDC055426]|uniref:NTP transferase domain-containing protein n=1 Tax=Citricoccus sp. NPDC055426 TaxID=3155536 RepID=UPI003442330F